MLAYSGLTGTHAVAAVIEKLAKGVWRPGPPSLLAVDGVQRLVDEEAQAAAERDPPGHL